MYMCFREYFPSGTQYLVFNIFDWIFTRSLNKHIHLLACTRFKMHSDGNVLKIIGVCFKFKYMYLMTKRVFLQLLNNVFLTKILVNAPLKTFWYLYELAMEMKFVHVSNDNCKPMYMGTLFTFYRLHIRANQ